ncbi:MAG TPA: dTDP-4-dehydrorhamnose 3,5-epimerase, partial [Spirochaetota bacterium]|nr:dTDP-4-dehydrorhamnose 3,5-epimerase [Spirochaetota bacterium]
LHYQKNPFAQGKLVRVTRGCVWDVAVDLREKSATFGKWFGIKLDDVERTMFYLPPGFAHGFVTLSDTAEFLYKCTAEYNKESEGGIKWNDSDLKIEWPCDDVLVSDKDKILPALSSSRGLF